MTITNEDDRLRPLSKDGDEPAAAFVQIRARKKKTTWPWLLAAMVVVFIGSVVIAASRTFTKTGSLAADIGYGVGFSIFPAVLLTLVVYAVLHLAVLKRSNRNNGTKYLALLVVTALLGCTAVAMLDGVIHPSPLRVDMVRTALDATYAEQETQRAGLERELAATDPELFKATALKRPGGYDRAVAELNRRRTLMEKAIVADAAIRGRLRLAVDSAITDPAYRTRLMAEFDAGYQARQPVVDAYADKQRRLLDLNEEQVALLRRTPWEAQGENFLFYRPRDMRAFGARQTEIVRLTQEAGRDREHINAEIEAGRGKLEADLANLD